MAASQGYSEGVIITRDKRFVKVLELLPVNFYTLSETEQGNAIADFAAYLKVAPDQLQINVLTQKFNLNGYLKLMKNCLDCEQNESCREMILESMQYVPQLVEREAITHRFFLTFSYEPGMKAANNSPGAIAARLNEQAEVARRYLDRCGISVLERSMWTILFWSSFMNWSISIPRSISGSQRVRMICWGPSTVFTMKALSHSPGAEAGKSRCQKEKVVYAKEKKRGAAWAGGRRDNNP